ncbi:MAG: CoA-binding protein [Burkholderiaceae bacterium]|nr:MAG: CoA-binding protein [Burkholderiaceae bacterium]
MTESESIQQILASCRTVAVVGLSPKPHRASHEVAQYMQAHGWRIIPVNPNAREVLGQRAYASLAEAAQHERIDLVNVFRHSEEVPPVARDAIAVGAKALWLQLGIENEAALAQAARAGLLVVQNRCLKVEHARA